MKKIAIIEECCDCPYKWDRTGCYGDYSWTSCEHPDVKSMFTLEEHRDVTDFREIPDWCPLPDREIFK